MAALKGRVSLKMTFSIQPLPINRDPCRLMEQSKRTFDLKTITTQNL